MMGAHINAADAQDEREKQDASYAKTEVAGPGNFGMILGQNRGTVAYSNGPDTNFVSQTPHFLQVAAQKVCSGMKWQCVEYARRWWMEQRRLSFSDVASAYEIWDAAIFSLETMKKVSATQHVNGKASEYPAASALIIYAKDDQCPYGHVAVVTDVVETKEGWAVHLGEQNNDNGKEWTGDFSRTIMCQHQKEGYHLSDPFCSNIIGWLTPECLTSSA